MSLDQKVAELEASLAAAQAERVTLERQRSSGKPPRAPPSPGGLSPRAPPSPSSPFARSGSVELASASMQIASLEMQVCEHSVVLYHALKDCVSFTLQHMLA